MSDCISPLFEYINSTETIMNMESENNFIEREISIDNIRDLEIYFSNNSKFVLNDSFSFFNDKNANNYSDLNSLNISIQNLSFQSSNNTTENSNHFIHKKRKKHDKFASDNIKRKILNHYFKFLTDLLNVIIRFLFIEEKNKKKIQFLTLRYDFRNKNFDKKIFDNIKRKLTIKEVFLEYYNHKYQNKKKNSKTINEDVMEYITSKNNNVLNNILKKLCFEFINIYYNNERKINLSKYGSKCTIILPSKIKLFKDLLDANSSNDEKENEIYCKNMEHSIQENYLEKHPYFIVK